jgi:sugar fermentation stimulation protein A
MQLGNNVLTATFKSRPNRYMIIVQRHHLEFQCFFPNPGRLDELLNPGAKIAVDHVPFSIQRKTRYDAIAVKMSNRWISIDSRVPNKLVSEALRLHKIPELQPYDRVKSEVPFGNSRIDFLLEGEKGRCLVEVKSCTLVKDGVGIFPDAPTARGRRHLLELIRAKRRGFRACIIFVIQRDDVSAFKPNHDTDVDFSKALHLAHNRGVELYARRCLIKNFQISLDGLVKLIL